MTTADTNLQIVNSMTQSKLNELKNSEGKVPSLANQLVITDDNGVDESLEYTRTEVVYDMTSPNANINWGYTSGMDSGTTISGVDLTPYKSLKITMAAYSGCSVYFVDLKSTSLRGIYQGAGCMAVSDDGLGPLLIFGTAQTNSTKTNITVTSGFIRTNNNSVSFSYKTVKIEGVLKTPAMIYTGEELTAGNGINIANGVIGIKQAQSVALNTTRTEQNDTVVEYYVSSDGNTWYRKWSSGWKECGGTYTMPEGGSGIYNNFTIPLKFDNIPITSTLNLIYNANNWGVPFYMTTLSNEKFGIYKYSTVAIRFSYYFAGF